MCYINVLSVSPQILSPVKPTKVPVLYTDESTLLTCVATAKPDLNASTFSWTKDGSRIDNSCNYSIDFHVGTTGSYVYGLTQSWNSSLQMDVQTKIFTCDNVVDYDGSYQCTVSENRHSIPSPPITLETLCKLFIILVRIISHFEVYLFIQLFSPIKRVQHDECYYDDASFHMFFFVLFQTLPYGQTPTHNFSD